MTKADDKRKEDIYPTVDERHDDVAHDAHGLFD